MSSSMPIPTKQRSSPQAEEEMAASPGSLGSTPPSSSLKSKGKGRAMDVPVSTTPSSSAARTRSSWSEWELSPRRPSLLGSSLSKSSYTVVNLSGGHSSEGPTRLVTCIKSSQGFDWNQELFLPSYVNYDYDSQELEHRPDPVQEIRLTDEEAEAILPH